MSQEKLTAEQHLAEVQKLATARLKACNVAARHERLVLVDLARLEALERLLVVVKAEFGKGAVTMTRDYKDVLESDPKESYNGKR